MVTFSIGSAAGLIIGLIIGFLIGGVVVIKSREQNGYYFMRVGEKWVMWFPHPQTLELVQYEGYNDSNDHSNVSNRITH